ncbi:MAG: TetR family transcriptional regulator [Comamonadaceae bacterium]|nr:TetR family transcriptional regulator [Comamonadaceae bacterium]
MNHKSSLFVLSALGAATLSLGVHAGMVTDANGNVGYDTAAECDMAVQAGAARFYEPVTRMRPLRRQGEASVRTARLSDLGPEYARGACDLGVGHQDGRDGVSKTLQGKYVPFSPDMPVNLYLNRDGAPVRASMGQCDNRFSDVRPRPVAVAAPAPAPAPAPVAVPPPAPAPAPAPAPQPLAAEPAPAAPVERGMNPYAFGTIGMVRDSAIYGSGVPGLNVDDNDSKTGAQIGAGLQFNDLVGAEVFYQGGKMLSYTAANGYENRYGTRIFGARATFGRDVSEKARVFAKVGLARVNHHNSSGNTTHWTQPPAGTVDYSVSQTRATVGLGATFDLTDNLALRADFDHYQKRGSDNPKWRNLNYFGVGLQFNF